MTDHQMATSLFTEMRLNGNAQKLAWLEYEKSPQGVVACALASFEGLNPAGLFLHKLKEGEHLRGGGERRTGWTFKRGTHSGHYVRDPKGVDALPPGYGALG